MFLKNHITLFLRIQQSRSGLVKLFGGCVPKLFINFEVLSCAYANFEEKNKVFEPSKKNCLNTKAYSNI